MALFRIRVHLIPLLLAAFWLPFQAVAAMAMPMCRHGEAHKMVVAERSAEAPHCQTHKAHEVQDRQGGADDHAQPCDNCEFCHLAAAGFMPTAEYIAAVIHTGRDFQSDVPLARASAIPEPPQQPPKRSA